MQKKIVLTVTLLKKDILYKYCSNIFIFFIKIFSLCLLRQMAPPSPLNTPLIVESPSFILTPAPPPSHLFCKNPPLSPFDAISPSQQWQNIFLWFYKIFPSVKITGASFKVRHDENPPRRGWKAQRKFFLL